MTITDNDSTHQIMGCGSAKEMWETIELVMEEIEEVKEKIYPQSLRNILHC